MVELPYKYKGMFNNDYEIVGWKGFCLQTRKGNHVFTLSRADTQMLLNKLGLKMEDIPGSPVKPVLNKWDGWDTE